MAKKNAPKTETPVTSETAHVTPVTAAQHDAVVRKAEKAFLVQIDAGNDGANERHALLAAKSARADFMKNRLPIAARSYVTLVDGGADEATLAAAVTELRSALSGISKPTVVGGGTPEV